LGNSVTNNNPYPGIRSFETGENNLFFGREKQISELLEILKGGRFVAVTGASGSGKSSLIKAGVIPQLTNSDGSWDYVVFRPGNTPLLNMAVAFIDILKRSNINVPDAESPEKAVEMMRSMPNSDFSLVMSELGYQKKMFIYIDQFEEIFRFSQNVDNEEEAKDAKLFVNILISSIRSQAIPIYSIITLRTDFLSDCTFFSGLPELINDGNYLIPKITEAEKKKIITGPAEISNTPISNGLPELILKDVLEQKSSLPVLQHVLMRSWENWNKGGKSQDLSADDYFAVGTVTEALSVHAENIYASIPNEKGKRITEKVFKALTHLGDDSRGTRRPTRLGEIAKITKYREEEIIPILNRFRNDTSSFLVPPITKKLNSNSIIDISHESIMRVWKRLVRWVDEETKSAQLYIRLSKSAELYQAEKTGLLVNPDLQLALKWLEDETPNAAWAMRYDPAFIRTEAYINYSKKEHDRLIIAKEDKIKRELKRARFFTIFLGAASIISVLFLIIALTLQFKAQDSEKKAKDKEAAALGEKKIADEKKKEALSHKRIADQQKFIAEQERILANEQKRYAIEQKGIALHEKAEADTARRDAELAQIEAERLEGVAVKARLKADSLRKEAIVLKDLAENSKAKTDTLRKLSIAKSLAVQAVKLYQENASANILTTDEISLPKVLAIQSFSLNNKNGNEAGQNYNPTIFDALFQTSESQKIIRGKDSHSDAIRDLKISSNGKSFISCSDDGSIRLFNHSEIPKSTTIQKKSNEGIRSIAFGNDDSFIVAGTEKGKIKVWFKDDNYKTTVEFNAHQSAISRVLTNGSDICTAARDGSFKVWKKNNNTFVLEKTIQTNSPITNFSFSKDKTKLLIAGSQGAINIYRASDYENIAAVSSPEGKILSSLWLTSNSFAVGFSSGKFEVRKGNEPNIILTSFFAHASGITSIAQNQRNGILCTSSYDGSIKIWQSSDFEIEPAVIQTHDSWVYAVEFDKSGKTIYSAGKDKSIQISIINPVLLEKEIRKTVSKNMSNRNWEKFVGKDIPYDSKLPN